MSKNLLDDLKEQVEVAQALGMHVPGIPGMVVYQIVAITPSTFRRNMNPYGEEDERGFEYSLIVKMQEDFKFSLGDLYSSIEEAEAKADELNNGIHSGTVKYMVIPQMIK